MEEKELTVEERLLKEIEKLKKDLNEAMMACEHNRHLAEEEQLKNQLRYQDGVIYGLKYALRCDGISGGEVN